jgi:hypothetical protein
MTARFHNVQEEGFDAIEPDDMDGFSHRTLRLRLAGRH